MDFQEYNASKKDSVRRPFISLLPEDGIYKFLEENFTYAFEFEFARFASMYFLRDKRTRQSVNDLSNYSPKEPQSPLLPVRRQFPETRPAPGAFCFVRAWADPPFLSPRLPGPALFLFLPSDEGIAFLSAADGISIPS